MEIIDFKQSNLNRVYKYNEELKKTQSNFKQLKSRLLKKQLLKIITFNKSKKRQIQENICYDKTELDKLEQQIFRLTEKITALEKGVAGEKLVREHLKEQLSDSYYLINNFYFFNNSPCEIDHIIVGPAGFVIVETKHLGGKLFVHPCHYKWLRAPLNNPDAIKKPMKNPLKQLERNVAEFKSLLSEAEMGELPVQGVLVFPRNSCLLSNRGCGEEFPVLYHDELIEYIDSLEKLDHLSDISRLNCLVDNLIDLANQKNKRT
ncbi:nuclease-related domain-containing protein [Natranaerobius thermophilus]|uniref:NERD domain protein n=1 Tax=Natranaerobius thermophilus (strain ATCC BAA-1301 / DSM 18059 / JW/NM-WN-LF) TaxID=457570 RepID=B2A5U5_NATTJ|nr:nuclease-related domain-containing protein [Natranaerobius thermophilus]ACB84038.1 NERD domain protein [Natranaerobius thermophilus JW/NM-WN-LF]